MHMVFHNEKSFNFSNLDFKKNW